MPEWNIIWAVIYTLEVLFKSLLRSSLEYADVIWDHGCSESDSNLLESLQIEGARVVTGALKETSRVSPLKRTFLGRSYCWKKTS